MELFLPVNPYALVLSYPSVERIMILTGIVQQLEKDMNGAHQSTLAVKANRNFSENSFAKEKQRSIAELLSLQHALWTSLMPSQLTAQSAQRAIHWPQLLFS